MDNVIVIYYEFYFNMVCGFDIVVSYYFDEEVIGDYVSDLGVYYDDNLCLGFFDEDVEDR